ncbi:MAG: TetR/AcrR family transcriptional regulator [Gemmatimonadota bacterium]
MSAINQPQEEDPRVVRSRAAAIEAARELFLRNGYAGTTMEEIAAEAGLSKRTLYNVYADKASLFTRMVADVIAYAERFARELSAGATLEAAEIDASDVRDILHDLGRRLALAILRPEVIALRRLLICEGRSFPALADEYFDAAPGRVMAALAADFEELMRDGLLRTADPRRAAEQFAYLVAGSPLDRALLLGRAPSEEQLVAGAKEGVATFLARYGTGTSASADPR